MVKVKRIFFLALVLTTTTFAQFENSSFANSLYPSKLVNTLESDISTFYDVGINFVKSPLQFNKNDFYLTGAILGVTALSIPVDEPLRKTALNSKSKSLDNVFYVTEKFGKAKYGAALSGVLYGFGLVVDDDNIRQTGQMLAEALIFNGLITTGAKMMFSRERPFTNEGSYDMDLFEFKSTFSETSLPSGHTSTAFTMATVLSERIDNTYASIALYSMASLTAFQRVYADKHWFSDTILGAALGTVIGLKIVNLHEGYSSSQTGFQYSIYPSIQNGNYGVGLALQF